MGCRLKSPPTPHCLCVSFRSLSLSLSLPIFLSLSLSLSRDSDAIPPFVTTSRDRNLAAVAAAAGARFTGSTSSVTSALSQLYFLFSAHKPTDTSALSSAFRRLPRGFTRAASKPASIVLRPLAPEVDGGAGLAGVDADTGLTAPVNQILLDLGKTMERAATLEEDEFRRLFVRQGEGLPSAAAAEASAGTEAYNYLHAGSFVLRSQLDAQDRDAGIFDLKTRATVAVRYNVASFYNHLDYRLSKLRGPEASFEREFYDMIRSAFLKYGLQARIGGMDGVMVTYHNTASIFGYEFVNLDEMDQAVYGSSSMARTAFDTTLQLFDDMLVSLQDQFPAEPLRVIMWANKRTRALDVFVERLGTGDEGWKEKGTTDGAKRGSYEPEALQEIQRQVNLYTKDSFWNKVRIDNPVHKYRLDLRNFVNEKPHRPNSPLQVGPEDRLQTFTRWTEVTDETPEPQRLTEYRNILRHSHLLFGSDHPLRLGFDHAQARAERLSNRNTFDGPPRQHHRSGPRRQRKKQEEK